ncbi:hypothetical protein U0070_018534 [Myodes glareolus]|uniref:Heparanase n=1 Tax=Myodes glareolus TaxID=447135 RepID=A0AAW0JVQ7_MYOGA
MISKEDVTAAAEEEASAEIGERSDGRAGREGRQGRDAGEEWEDGAPREGTEPWRQRQSRSGCRGRELPQLLAVQPGEMRLLLLLLGLWGLWGPLGALAQGAPARTALAEDVVDLEFSTEQPLHLVSPSFLSVTIDANLATDPRFLTFLGSEVLVGTLSLHPKQSQTDICRSEPVSANVVRKLQAEWPFFELFLLREQHHRQFKNSTYSRSTVDMLYSFAKCSGLDLIFGLNALLRTPDLRWNSSNAQLLLGYCASKGYNISWELGNEPNSFWKKAHVFIDGLQLGEDFVELRKLLRKSAFKNAKLYGPDIGQPRGKTVKLLRSFLKAGGGAIDSMTWHHYYLNGRIATKEDFLSSDVLDTFILSVQKILKVTKKMRPGKKVWLGETSSAYGGGAPALSDTFAAGFLWLDKLGVSAQMGIEVVMRQVFFGAGNYHLVDENFEPLPDYWLSLLFKKLVGPRVLTVQVKGPARSKLRVYLHCTNTHQSVQLNGETLKMVDDQTLPALTEKPLRPGSSLGMPAFSYGFFVIRNAKIAACL